MTYQLNKFGSLCSHDYQKSLTNSIDLPCSLNENHTHQISQIGKICNKCTQIIKDSYKLSKECIVCSDTILSYLSDRELCPHENRVFQEINVRCLNDQPPINTLHNIVFKNKICNRCYDKLRAAFMNSQQCKICQGKEQEVIRDLQNVFISPAYNCLKNVMKILRQNKCVEEVYKDEVQFCCKGEPLSEKKGSALISKQIYEEYNNADRREYHESKRYKLYPKCEKHRERYISVCNMCLVAILNLEMCPFGCEEEVKIVQKAKKEVSVKVAEAGFLNLYPQIQLNKDGYHLEMFVIRQTEEKGRLDRWEAMIKKIQPKGEKQVKFQPQFTLYSAAVSIDDRQYLICGGVAGKSITEMKAVNSSFLLTLTKDQKQFEISKLAKMNQPRSSHALVFHSKRKMVFAIGGYSRETGFLKSNEVYSLESQEWYGVSDLNIQRSKPSAFLFHENVYVFGGLTDNNDVWDCLGEKLNFEQNKWEKLCYNGFDFPSVTNMTASSSILSLQGKDSILLFGGSNCQEYTYLIQTIQLDKNTFSMNSKGNYFKMSYARSGCVLGMIGNDTIICFGGLNEHESIMNIDALKIRATESDFSPIFAYDDIQLGSYRLMLREGSQSTYTKMVNQLNEINLASKQKLDNSEEGLASAYNAQLLERMWYTVGKIFVWVSM